MAYTRMVKATTISVRINWAIAQFFRERFSGDDQADEADNGNCREDQRADPGADGHVRILPCVGIAVVVVHVIFLLLSKFRGYNDYNTYL